MFGTKFIGARDVLFDSQEEAAVASHLETLCREHVVAGYFVHPVVSGLVADFLVQLGERSMLGGGLVVLEYDGLGVARRESLAGKVQRYAELGPFGIHQAWVSTPTYEAVASALANPGAPHLIRKILYCPACGSENCLYVIGAEDFTEEKVCDAHQEGLAASA